MRFSEWLEKNGACKESIKWVGKKAFERAWKECKHPGWMLYFMHEYCALCDAFSHGTRVAIEAKYNKRFKLSKRRRESGVCLGAAGQDYINTGVSVARCNWLRAQMEPYLPDRMGFK